MHKLNGEHRYYGLAKKRTPSKYAECKYVRDRSKSIRYLSDDEIVEFKLKIQSIIDKEPMKHWKVTRKSVCG